MSYRIQIQPEAGTLLRTLAPHTVLRLGRALAELADSIEAGVSPRRARCASTTACCNSWSTTPIGWWRWSTWSSARRRSPVRRRGNTSLSFFAVRN